jgi:hypothetical protein
MLCATARIVGATAPFNIAGHGVSFHRSLDRGFVVLLLAAALVSAIVGIGIETACSLLPRWWRA